MLRKRLIFTLLYDSGSFMLSRNFRLQRVGDLDWLQRNYDFSHIAFYIDELIVLDVTRGERNFARFAETLNRLSADCFVPIAAGGGVRHLDDARQLLRSGADKIVINTPLFSGDGFMHQLAQAFGQQCVVGSVDLKQVENEGYRVATQSGTTLLDANPTDLLASLDNRCVGELYLNSIDRDGTGQGYDFGLLDILPAESRLPTILAGGVGNGAHLAVGLADPRVDAAATAHLFNFVGDGLQRARESLLADGAGLASWPSLAELNLTRAGRGIH